MGESMTNDLKHYAFSGTRQGMTDRQRASVEFWFSQKPRAILHHGRCVGADHQAHAIVKARDWLVCGHPPKHTVWMCQCEACQMCDVLRPPTSYLVRNNALVAASDELLAAPRNYEMQVRGSGTWQAVRTAIRLGKPRTIVYPDGSIGPSGVK